MLLVIALFSASSFSTEAGANSARFTGMGTHVYPIKEENIALRNEELEITALCSDDCRTRAPGPDDDIALRFDEWQYEVAYRLENTADEPIRMKVGFPDITGVESQPGRKSLLLDFAVSVDGKPVRFERQKGRRNPKVDRFFYQDVITWQMSFESCERHTLEIRYRTKVIHHNTGAVQLWYSLMPASLWKNGIESLHMKVQFFEDLYFEYSDDDTLEKSTGAFQADHGFPFGAASCIDGKVAVEWDMKQFYPHNNLNFYFMSTEATDSAMEESLCGWVDRQAALTGLPPTRGFIPGAALYAEHFFYDKRFEDREKTTANLDWFYGRVRLVNGCLVIEDDNGDFFEPTNDVREFRDDTSDEEDDGPVIDVRGFLMTYADEGYRLFGYPKDDPGGFGECLLGPAVEVIAALTLPSVKAEK